MLTWTSRRPGWCGRPWRSSGILHFFQCTGRPLPSSKFPPPSHGVTWRRLGRPGTPAPDFTDFLQPRPDFFPVGYFYVTSCFLFCYDFVRRLRERLKGETSDGKNVSRTLLEDTCFGAFENGLYFSLEAKMLTSSYPGLFLWSQGFRPYHICGGLSRLTTVKNYYIFRLVVM